MSDKDLVLETLRHSLDISRNTVDELIHRLRNRDREIEVLTQERDNALLRVEELERELHQAPTLAMFSEGAHLNLDTGEYRGGVHPNA